MTDRIDTHWMPMDRPSMALHVGEKQRQCQDCGARFTVRFERAKVRCSACQAIATERRIERAKAKARRKP